MAWYFFVFISVFLFALTNLMDSYLSNKSFSNIWSLLFYVNLLNLVFLPILFILGWPRLPLGGEWLSVAGAGILFSFSIYPYFKAFQHEDTSTTMSLFSLEYVFTPVLAFLLLKELMQPYHYLGIAILAICAFMITWKGRMNFSKALFYMIFSVMMVVAVDLLLKVSAENLGWLSASFWTYFFGSVGSLIIWPFHHKEIRESYRSAFLPNIRKMLVNEFFSFSALVALIYSLSIAPLTLVTGLFATKPLFILVLTVLGHRFWPDIFKEDISKKALLKKSFFFILMIIGVVLLVN
jgi:drug/metabolite transporter (DMT)-like permease